MIGDSAWVLLLSAAVAAAAAFAGALQWRRWALARGLLDPPGEDRRLHAAPTPRGGGIGIAAVLLAAAPALGPGLAWPFAVGLVLTAGTGLVDDLRPLPAWAKALGQLAGAVPLAWALPMLLAGGEGPLATGLALLWVIALVNAFNFIDGSHGMAATQAALVGVAGVVLAAGQGAGAWLGCMLAAACLGFLPLNLPVARVFLGDVGSHALGYAAAAGLLLAADGRAPVPVLALVPLATVLADTGVTLAARLLRGHRPWQAHRDHLYQRVIVHGHSHLAVCLGYGAWTAAGLAGMAVFLDDPARAPAAVLAWLLASVVLRVSLGRRWRRIGPQGD